MKLYIHPSSPNARAALVVAGLLNLKLDVETVALTPGGVRDDAYLAINPNGYVPTLIDGDFTLWECEAINQYFCDKCGGSEMWPSDLQRRADISRWQFWSKCHWIPTLQTFIYENHFKGFYGQGQPDQDKIASAEPKFHKFASILDRQLGETGFVAGDKLSLADISLAAYLMYAEPATLPMAPYAKIQIWSKTVLALDAWRSPLPAAA